ncbi:hypothetical protein [Planctomicrobium sp. SH664]|uniref:hypothetical protein n=1 Tax=Planctomicrobium sp. SH664 TaxID=3448125 RepID=UPI003F5C33F9
MFGTPTGRREHPEGPQPNFEDLVRKAFEGTIVESEFDRLQQELRESPENRRFYLDYASVHALLTLDYDETNPLSLKEPQPRRLLQGSLVAAASLLVCLGLWLGLRSRQVDSSSVATAEGPAAPVVQSSTTPAVFPVAEVLRIVTPQSDFSTRIRELGRSLLPNETVEIGNELAHVRFKSGANLVLQGPASLKVSTPLRCQLRSGIATCEVPPEAMGFTVQLAGADIVDLGTSFGVSQLPGQSGEVSVFSGKIQAYSLSLDGGSQPGPVVEQNAALQLHDGETPWREIPFDSRKYSAALGLQRGILSTSSGVQYLDTPPADLLPGSLESSDRVFLFFEQNNIQWPEDLHVDSVGRPADSEESRPVFEEWKADGGVSIATISAQEEVLAEAMPTTRHNLTSFLLHYDPPGEPVVPAYDSGEESEFDREGQISFAGKIVGLMWRDQTLAATDAVAGAVHTAYCTGMGLHRSLSKGSTIEVSPDQRTLKFKFLSRKESRIALKGIDELRILIEMDSDAVNQSPVSPSS